MAENHHECMQVAGHTNQSNALRKLRIAPLFINSVWSIHHHDIFLSKEKESLRGVRFYKPIKMISYKLLLPFSKYLFSFPAGSWYFIFLLGAYIISDIFKCEDQLSIFILQFRSEFYDFISFKEVISFSKCFLNNNYALSQTLSGCSMSISLQVATCLLQSTAVPFEQISLTSIDRYTNHKLRGEGEQRNMDCLTLYLHYLIALPLSFANSLNSIFYQKNI